MQRSLPSRARAGRLRARLVEWYRQARRDLPWRRTSDAYAIWVSEAMLQQTRVETVIDYYGRFLERFPTAGALAAAEEEDVLALWSGLGYYRRARALHAAARVLVREHGGEFPTDPEAALALPGVGRYTAGAVLSIAYDQPRALVDGNVERVFARLFELDFAAGSKELAARTWALAERFIAVGGGAGEWNQALMELGATVCMPRAPRCDGCPLARSCAARRAGRAAELPRPKVRPAVVPVTLALALARRGRELLFERRGSSGRMAGMWQLPTIEIPLAAGTSGLFPDTWTAGAELRLGASLAELSHSITHHRIRAVVHDATVEHLSPGSPYAWLEPDELERRASTGMTRKALARAGTRLASE